MCLFQQENGMRYDVAKSQHAFYAPKRFTISPGLTITKVRIWGPEPSKMSKNLNRFLTSLFFSQGFQVHLEAK